jgi:hypothetical protein
MNCNKSPICCCQYCINHLSNSLTNSKQIITQGSPLITFISKDQLPSPKNNKLSTTISNSMFLAWSNIYKQVYKILPPRRLFIYSTTNSPINLIWFVKSHLMSPKTISLWQSPILCPSMINHAKRNLTQGFHNLQSTWFGFHHHLTLYNIPVISQKQSVYLNLYTAISNPLLSARSIV